MGETFTDTINEREKSQEAKYKLDEEQRFKAQSRRNKLLGLWAAKRLGMTKAETEEFAGEVVLADFEEPGVGNVVRRVAGEFDKRGVEIAEQEIQLELERLYPIALEQIARKFPDALDKDHEKVGG